MTFALIQLWVLNYSVIFWLPISFSKTTRCVVLVNDWCWLHSSVEVSIWRYGSSFSTGTLVFSVKSTNTFIARVCHPNIRSPFLVEWLELNNLLDSLESWLVVLLLLQVRLLYLKFRRVHYPSIYESKIFVIQGIAIRSLKLFKLFLQKLFLEFFVNHTYSSCTHLLFL